MYSARDMLQCTMEKRLRKRATLQHVLQRCYKDITRSASQEHTSCLCEIPEVILGLPAYNLRECTEFVREQLIARGFEVSCLSPKMMVVRWDAPDAEATTSAGATNTPQVRTAAARSLLLPARGVEPQPRRVQEGGFLLPPMLTANRLQQDVQSVKRVDLPARVVAPAGGVLTVNNLFCKSIADLKPSGKFVLAFD